MAAALSMLWVVRDSLQDYRSFFNLIPAEYWREWMDEEETDPTKILTKIAIAFSQKLKRGVGRK